MVALYNSQLYTDATLACDGKFYNVHRLVLSTCSDYFSAMFDRTTCKNPIIVLKDIKCEDLEALLDYMYLGEVNVRQADLASLIKAAECLRVKGLAVPDDEPPQKRGRGDTSNLRRSDGGSPPSKRKRRDEGQDGREDIRPSGGSGSSRPKTPQSHSRLSPVPPQEGVSDSKPSPASRLQGSSDDLAQSETAHQNPFVKVEMEDTGGEDLGSSGDAFNINADGYKEEPDNDAGDPGGDLSNDLPEFLQQASGSHLGAGGGTNFGTDSYPPSSSFQSGDLGWQGEGSNLNYPGHMNYSSTETSSQNAPGSLCILLRFAVHILLQNFGTKKK
ncbi:Kelch repeat and BTB domain-containing protein 2 [Armadillidium nasatum]|uniref:Kelch repeat and BTB domain-containing protein 2 n=1 Tax=Armadillidium nasatum TaxID=96803 RepID=A0A5N5SK49_9CRUS|nr:Kelch repeat and BTB domain-containing protein 2 [Armadillidium nasatum]